jgi:integrase
LKETAIYRTDTNAAIKLDPLSLPRFSLTHSVFEAREERHTQQCNLRLLPKRITSGRRAISEFQVKQTAYPNAGRSWYIVGRPGGKRIRAWFDTQLAAEAAATQRNLSIQRFGQQAASFSGSLAYMAMECQTRLQEYGKSLQDATAHYLRHLEGVNRSVPLSQVTAAVRREFERRLAAGEISQRHLESMLMALRRLDEKFGQCAGNLISGSEIKVWLSNSDWSTKTRNNLLGYFHNAFNVARELRLLTDNPLLETRGFNASKVSKKDNPRFLTVPQMTELLNSADPSLIPYLSISAFAGLRSAEAKSLSWQQVDLKRKLITVPENISKTGEERKSPIRPNLAAWLAPQVQANGFILPREHCHRIDDLLKSAKVTAGLWPWSPRFQNALRKSFCSYHYEMFGSADRTAEYAGHDVRTLVKIYRHSVPHEEAKKFWVISPR